MSLFKKVLGTVVEFDEDKSQAAAPAVASTAVPAGATVTTSVYDAEMLETLNKVVTGRKTSYTALVETSAKLSAVIPDETQRLKAAFVTIAGDGQRSLGDVIKAIDVHVSDLEGQLTRFSQSSDLQLKQKSGALRAQAQTLQHEVEANLNEIATLTARIASLTQRNQEASGQASELARQADAAESEVKAVTERFSRTVQYAVADLQRKKQQLSTVLS